MSLDPKTIKDALVVDENEIAQQMLTRIQVHLGLTSKGQIHIRNPDRYRQRDRVLLYLAGVRYAFDAKMRDSESASLSEICSSLGLDSKVVAARLGDLKNEGKVENPARGDYQVVFVRLGQILNEIEAARPSVGVES